MVGQDYPSAVAALKSNGITAKEEIAGDGKRLSWTSGSETVELQFAPWPSDPDAPASAWEPGSSAPKKLTLVRILDTAPSSEGRRAWVNSLARDGDRWAYLDSGADAKRDAADRTKYPVAASVAWKKPPARLLFEAARPANAPPGSEPTRLDIRLRNPHASSS